MTESQSPYGPWSDGIDTPPPSPAGAGPAGGDGGEGGGAAGPGRAPDPPGRKSRRGRGCGCALALGGLLLAAALGAGLYEIVTSRLQSALFTRMASEFGYSLGEGPSPRWVVPAEGPHDVRLGYARIPELSRRLDSLGFALTHQARVTEGLQRAVEWGAYPVYPEKTSSGLLVLDRSARPVVAESFPRQAYAAFDSIPELLWRTLLFIESRDFLNPRHRRRNPAVEWIRLVRSAGELGLRLLGAGRSVPGGSTLATQIEKFRHSPGGLTLTPRDKLRQMATASLRAYWDGPDTYEERKAIVTDYLNSAPLAAQAGHGEVIGTAEGLWAWYGRELAEVDEVLRSEPRDSVARARKGEVYREVLGLLVAHRRPSYYLVRPEGRRGLADLVDGYLTLLARELVIPLWLAEEARRARGALRILERAPALPPPAFSERKAADQVRTHLLWLTGLPGLYQLDRQDLTALSTLGLEWHEATTELLRSMGSREFLATHGFTEPRLLDAGDPSRVLYAVTLLERTPRGNVVRIQTDNFEGPLSLAAASRLELGSTAKLRTLVTYLEVVEELHRRLSGLPPDSLRGLEVATGDRLTRWAADHLLENPGATLEEMLEAAMLRRYPASPTERFETGGGTQTFSNFDREFDRQVLSVREAFRHSVNLPFVRLMRELVAYEIHRSGLGGLLEDRADPLRQEYLARFADEEGSLFVRQFYRKYAGRTGPEIFEVLAAERRLGHRRLAWAFRAVASDAPEELFRDFLAEHAPDEALGEADVPELFRRSDPRPHTLSDLGFLARVHPLELWVASFLLHNPGATLGRALEESREARLEVYGWLFRTRRASAQDVRIRAVLEMEAFQEILRRWRRVGYPFENIVPSLGTAIGSSGDRPLALAELAGILVNGGVRYPVVRVEGVRVAEDTPFETRFELRPSQGERVLGEAVAAAARAAMEDVVAEGTGRRVRGSLVAADGTVLRLGGKTGTGDNRYQVFGRGGGVVESRVVNRTATFVFLAGDRYFGVVTAYVPGAEAGSFRFTSGLPTQLLRVLGPRLEGLEPPAASPSPGL